MENIEKLKDISIDNIEDYLFNDFISANDYSQKSQSQLQRYINYYYDNLALLLDKQISDKSKDPEERLKLYEKQLEYQSHYYQTWYSLATRVADNYMESFNGDYDALLKATIKRIDSIIKEHAIYAVARILPEGREIIDNWISGTVSSAISAEKFVKLAEEQSEDTGPQLTAEEARACVRSAMQYVYDYLFDNSPEHAVALMNAINEAIDSSPYVYRQGEEPARSKERGTDTESGISSHSRPPLPVIKTFGLMNDKVVNRISSGDLAEQKTPEGNLIYRAGINQAQAGQKKVVVDLKLAFEGENTELSKPVNDYDIAVYNAVSTAFFYHNAKNPRKPLYITPQEIWRTMNGIQDAKSNPSASQVQAVCDSVDKMRSTFARMDITQELQAFKRNYKDSRIKSGLIETYLLNASKATFTTEKGNTVTGYRVLEEPVLYTYNKENEHLIFIPIELLDTSATTRNEAYVTNFRQYLLRQIENMYSGERDSKRILFNTVYKSTGITPPELRPDPNAYKSEKDYNAKINKERKKDKDKIFSILESFRIKDYIKDFAPVKNGRTFTGVDIVLFEEKIKKKKKKK